MEDFKNLLNLSPKEALNKALEQLEKLRKTEQEREQVIKKILEEEIENQIKKQEEERNKIEKIEF